MKMSFENCYISANCNQTPTAADWGKNNLICYASCNSVLIYDPYFDSGGKIIHTLIGHTKRVNSVKWISKYGSKTDRETELVSGSTDGSVIVWSLKGDKYVPTILNDHKSIVNIVDAVYKNDNKENAIIISVSMDFTIKIWYRLNINDDVKLTQTINLKNSIAMSLKIGLLPDSNNLLIACGLENSKIYFYTENDDKIEEMFSKSVFVTGHEDWVRGLDFTADVNGDLILASSSQDSFIRLWRISSKTPEQETGGTKRVQMKTSSKTYEVTLESVLAGHEGWIHSVNWSPISLQLLSASIDKSMIIWEYDKESGLWLEKIRVGEVGGNILGFYGGLFSNDGNSVLAYSYHGSFHIWNKNRETSIWEPVVTIGGHFEEVTDLGWEPKGTFLVSASSDQTTRIHAPWSKQEKSITWHEIARPQVHGYDMNCLAILSRYKFASGADEKVTRIFEAPKSFIENFRRICKISDDLEGNNIINSSQLGPKGASVPSLGLSNKAVFTNDNLEDTQSMDKKNPFPEESHFTATELEEPPTEETLLQNTLWPEVQKLYGHGYELYALAASPDGLYLASACKSSSVEHSAVLIWDTSNWKLTQKLLAHTLTIVQMEFSPDSQHLISVSRDRRWSLFSKNELGDFELTTTTSKTTAIHSRIIWCCSWSHDGKHFVTGSRDGKAVVWTLPDSREEMKQFKFGTSKMEWKNESVTAVASAPVSIQNDYLIALGFESGVIRLFKWSSGNWREVLVLNQSDAHHLTVKRLRFRPVLGKAGESEEEKNVIQLASCGSDFAVKIFNIFIDKL